MVKISSSYNSSIKCGNTVISYLLFKTWRENPDRLVGFMPRSAVFNESTKSYQYHVECENSMNIILMRAAFYHKVRGNLSSILFCLRMKKHRSFGMSIIFMWFYPKCMKTQSDVKIPFYSTMECYITSYSHQK